VNLNIIRIPTHYHCSIFIISFNYICYSLLGLNLEHKIQLLAYNKMRIEQSLNNDFMILLYIYYKDCIFVYYIYERN